MRVAIITDTHFGARSDSIPFDNFFESFYNDSFFPEIEKQGVKTIIHLGDIFDRRKYINFNTLASCKKYFFDEARRRGIDIHLIPGNHDTYFKNTNEVNSPNLLLAEYDNIILYQDPTEVKFGNTNILLMPWICSENYAASKDALENADATICFGHFELAGFQMYKGVRNEHGMDPKIFNQFDLVCSGHFHHRDRSGNIFYLGNPYEITWSDYDDPRGFHIMETETVDFTFYENPYKMFHKVYYDDTNVQVMKQIEEFDYSTLQNRSVKLIVVNKTDFTAFDKLVDTLYTCNLNELKIIEDFSEFEDEAVGEENIDLEDTMTLLVDYVDNINTDLDRDRLKTQLRTLYVEAQDIQ